MEVVMKKLKTYLCVALVAILLSTLCLSCKSNGYMPKRKKSRCNTCPTFSYVPNNQIDERTTAEYI